MPKPRPTRRVRLQFSYASLRFSTLSTGPKRDHHTSTATLQSGCSHQCQVSWVQLVCCLFVFSELKRHTFEFGIGMLLHPNYFSLYDPFLMAARPGHLKGQLHALLCIHTGK